MLPDIPYKNGAAKIPVAEFGGLERRIGAGNGTIRDMVNLTGADAPVLSSRPKRKTVAAATKPHGIFSAGRLFTVNGTVLSVSGMAASYAVADSDKVFAALGERVVIFPDKKLWTASDGLQALEATATASCTFANGTYAGEPAEGNTILAPSGFNWSQFFKVGDAVTISGAADAYNNKTPIVREISGNELRFYENTFVVNSTARSITVKRAVPDMDYLCAVDNRVWGCKGDAIFCCKLGDPFNWNVFDGLSTDAWSVETGTPGSFTGCVSFMGYPVFFKDDRVFKVYGNRPQNFELMGSATLGVLDGAAKTLAVAGETLFYLSRAGFVRYSGGYPSAVDAALNAKYSGGAAGSDGRKYYVSALREDGAREFLVFDPQTVLWHKEDALAVSGMASVGNMLYAQTPTANIIVAGAANPDEANFESSVTFADFDLQTFASKYPVRLWLRMENAAAVTVKITYNGGALETVTTLAAGDKGTKYTPVPIRRCDRFGLQISTTGAWKLYSMEIETRAESTNRKGG